MHSLRLYRICPPPLNSSPPSVPPQARFHAELLAAMSLNGQWLYAADATARWIGFRLDMLASCVILAACLLAMAIRGTVQTSLLALALTQVFGITGGQIAPGGMSRVSLSPGEPRIAGLRSSLENSVCRGGFPFWGGACFTWGGFPFCLCNAAV